ncbi:MAG: hypothetical protein ABSF76_04145 [Opitutaceae bacterium]
MPFESEEPGLPYTPSNTGRRARVGYLGFDGVGFNDLWPLFAGIILSIAIALKLFIGEGADRREWLPRTAIALAPFAAGFGYLRLLVMGRPPHFRGDLWATALCLRLDFADPPLRAFPLIPRLRVDATSARGPWRAAGLRHPLRAKGRARGNP